MFFFNPYLLVIQAIDNERYALGKALLEVGKLISSHEDAEKYSITIEAKDILRKIISFIQFSKTNKVDETIIINLLSILE